MPPREITREPYAAVYVSAPWHTKVLSIPEGDRVAAFGFWAACLTLCQAHRNDGRIPRPQLAGAFACPEEQRQRLVALLADAGLFDDHGDEIRIHDYTDHNRTRAEIEDSRARMSEGGRKSGQARRKQPTKVASEGSSRRSTERDEMRSEEESSQEPKRDEVPSTQTKPYQPDYSDDEIPF